MRQYAQDKHRALTHTHTQTGNTFAAGHRELAKSAGTQGKRESKRESRSESKWESMRDIENQKGKTKIQRDTKVSSRTRFDCLRTRLGREVDTSTHTHTSKRTCVCRSHSLAFSLSVSAFIRNLICEQTVKRTRLCNMLRGCSSCACECEYECPWWVCCAASASTSASSSAPTSVAVSAAATASGWQLSLFVSCCFGGCCCRRTVTLKSRLHRHSGSCNWNAAPTELSQQLSTALSTILTKDLLNNLTFIYLLSISFHCSCDSTLLHTL